MCVILVCFHFHAAAAIGKDHPKVALIRTNIADVYKEPSKFTEALNEYHEALRVKIAAFEKDHPQHAATRNNIAIAIRSSPSSPMRWKSTTRRFACSSQPSGRIHAEWSAYSVVLQE